MTFNLTAQIQRDIQLNCSAQQAFELLKDIPTVSTLYPKLEKVEALGSNQWRWDLERMGAGGLTHQVTYAVAYSDNGSNKIAWKALPEQGNTKVSGEWEIKNSGSRCTLTFKSNNELELPYPRLMHKVLESMIQKELDDQINTFLERIKKHLEN